MGKTDRVGPPGTAGPIPPVVWAGAAAAAIAAVLAFVSPSLAAVPLTIFVLLCLVAPFFPRLGFFMPVITRGTGGTGAVALTFDDGPSSETTPLLLGLLKKYGVSSTHFVIGAKAALHPDLINVILALGHDLGNHSMNHDPLLMLRSSRTLREEISKCQSVLSAHKAVPGAFRPPAGIVNPRLRAVLLELGMYCVTFTRRGRDWGNRRVDGIARRILKGVRAGDIVMLHDCPPKGGSSVEQWLDQVEETIAGIREKGLRVVPLAELIGRPVMAVVRSPVTPKNT